jgi:demethylmenaquinone methyltransferase/2-methoxy-6-polyprenyl-1,4-benzoquinol methylase
VVADFSLPMIRRAISKHRQSSVGFTQADAMQLPFPDGTFDVVLITFATRNLNNSPGGLPRAFTEFYRVLKSGGCFINLETSQPGNPIIRKLFHFYVKLTVLPVGRFQTGSSASFHYLTQSIQTFHTAEKVTKILSDCGFQQPHVRKLLFGVVAVHVSRK